MESAKVCLTHAMELALKATFLIAKIPALRCPPKKITKLGYVMETVKTGLFHAMADALKVTFSAAKTLVMNELLIEMNPTCVAINAMTFGNLAMEAVNFQAVCSIGSIQIKTPVMFIATKMISQSAGLLMELGFFQVFKTQNYFLRLIEEKCKFMKLFWVSTKQYLSTQLDFVNFALKIFE